MIRTMPSWLNNTLFYEIYPQSFLDTNGDGIGDIAGIIRKLDYIKQLGCNAIWLNPCFVSPFQDAGYDVADYYKVAPRYGTNVDLKKLFTQANKRGMHIILDLVPGHTSIQHPWFIESSKPERNKYTDWYIWTNTGWTDAGKGFRSISGFCDREGQYVTNFFYSQPALNFGFAHPDPERPWQQPYNAPGPTAVRGELKKIMKFWLDMGASGFRVDMAASLVKGDKDCSYLNKLWGDIRNMLDNHYPDAVIISEWGKPNEAIRAGFHMDFMLHFGPQAYNSLFRRHNQKKRMTCFFSKNGLGDITEFLDYYLDIYKPVKDSGYICIPSGNHDMERLGVGRTSKELEVAFAFLLTMPGVPFIYYGDEIGMAHRHDIPSRECGFGRTGARTPMQWAQSRNAGFSSATPSRLYLPVDTTKQALTVEKQMKAHASLWKTIQMLIALRKKHPALCAQGAFAPLFAKKSQYPFIYQRELHGERFIIALNPSARKVSATFQLKKSFSSIDVLTAKGACICSAGKRIRCDMDGISYGIFRVIK